MAHSHLRKKQERLREHQRRIAKLADAVGFELGVAMLRGAGVCGRAGDDPMAQAGLRGPLRRRGGSRMFARPSRKEMEPAAEC